jgi:hypothetical protein
MAAKSLHLSSNGLTPEETFEVNVRHFGDGQMHVGATQGSKVVDSYWLSGGRYLFHDLDERIGHPISFDPRQSFILPLMVLRSFGLFGLCDVSDERQFRGITDLGDYSPKRLRTLNVEGKVIRKSPSLVTFSLRVLTTPTRTFSGSLDFTPPPFPVDVSVINWHYLLPGDQWPSGKRTNTTMATLGAFREGTIR